MYNLNLHSLSFFGGGNFRVTSFEFELDKHEPINKRSKHLFDSFIIDIASDELMIFYKFNKTSFLPEILLRTDQNYLLRTDFSTNNWVKTYLALHTYIHFHKILV